MRISTCARAALLLLLLCGSGRVVTGQELFVFSEPASNMPAGATGLRITNMLMQERLPAGTRRGQARSYNYHVFPELMWGVDKRLMVHLEGIFSNRTAAPGGAMALHAEGASVYGKYRFYSNDAMKRHFRMAIFARASVNNADIHQEEIVTNSHNTGYQLGWVGTQLLKRTALSLTGSYERALPQIGAARGEDLNSPHAHDAINGVASWGRLFFPKKYTGYKQTNVNLMAEVLTQYQPQTGRWFVDIAPSVQFIFNSQTRLDIGYRRELGGNMLRTAPNGLLVRVEHVVFGW